MALSNKSKKHIKNLSFIGLLFFSLSLVVLYYFFPQYVLTVYPFVVIYFVIFSVLQHYYLQKAIECKPKLFHLEYMKWFGLKFMLNLIFIISYVLLDKHNALCFVVYFFLCYLIFTAYEVYSLAFKSK